MPDFAERKICVVHSCQWLLLREGVRQSLSKKENIDFIGEATNGQELLELLQVKKPDVILLDYNMPVMNGLQILPLLKERYPDIRVLMLTIYNDPSIIIKALELGAGGYVTTEASTDDLYEAIISVYRSRPYFFVGVRPFLPLSMDRLRANEIKILECLSQKKSRETISGELGLSPIIVETIIGQLKKMGDVGTVEELVALAKAKGFIEKEVPPQHRPGRISIWRKLSIGKSAN